MTPMTLGSQSTIQILSRSSIQITTDFKLSLMRSLIKVQHLLSHFSKLHNQQIFFCSSGAKTKIRTFVEDLIQIGELVQAGRILEDHH